MPIHWTQAQNATLCYPGFQGMWLKTYSGRRLYSGVDGYIVKIRGQFHVALRFKYDYDVMSQIMHLPRRGGFGKLETAQDVADLAVNHVLYAPSRGGRQAARCGQLHRAGSITIPYRGEGVNGWWHEPDPVPWHQRAYEDPTDYGYEQDYDQPDAGHGYQGLAYAGKYAMMQPHRLTGAVHYEVGFFRLEISDRGKVVWTHRMPTDAYTVADAQGKLQRMLKAFGG